MMRRAGTRRPPGMMAVAELAGVSHQTVSRVLNHPEQVRPATRERVERAMAELGYVRNFAARALVTQQSALIGVVWIGAGHYGPASTVAGIEVAARAAGYSSLVAALGIEDDMAELIVGFRNRGVEGIAVVAPLERVAERALAGTSGVPTVLVAHVHHDVGLHTVAVDQQLGAELVVNHMIERGCRRIAHVSGPLDWFDASARIRGYEKSVVAAGLEPMPLLGGDWAADAGHDAAEQLVSGGELPDGVFCGNDTVALGLMAGLREAGVEVPGQVSVAGFDNLAGSQYYVPPLTTVEQPFHQLGALTVDVLVAAIAGQEPAAHLLDPELVIRQSVR